MSSLSWSNTRITVLEYCQKKYFFNYYGYALKDIDKQLWLESSLLRQLKSLDMRMGEMTHKILSTYFLGLKKGENVDVQQLKDSIKQEMEQKFLESKARNYTDYERYSGTGLSEHFYGEDVDNQLEPTIQKVWKNLDSLLASEWYQKIQHRMHTAHYVYIESPGKPNFDIMKVDVEKIKGLEGISVMAGPDFGSMFGENKYVILDWKSGKEHLDTEGITDQLSVYALKILLKQKSLQLGDREIFAYEIYVPSINRKGGKIEQHDVDTIIEKIVQDVSFQKQFLVNQDPLANKPVAHTAFKRTTSLKKCASCTFRDVCEKLKAKEII